MNGPRMAKIIRGNRNLFESNQFLHSEINVSSVLRNAPLLGASALNILLGMNFALPGQMVDGKMVIFDEPTTIPMQGDGETARLSNVEKLSVSKDSRPITVVRT